MIQTQKDLLEIHKKEIDIPLGCFRTVKCYLDLIKRLMPASSREDKNLNLEFVEVFKTNAENYKNDEVYTIDCDELKKFETYIRSEENSQKKLKEFLSLKPYLECFKDQYDELILIIANAK